MIRTNLVCFATFGVFLLAVPPAKADTVEAPDFARAGEVLASIERMQKDIAQHLRDNGGWQARRAEGLCADARLRLQWRRSSLAYDGEAGEAIWRDCHDAYRRIP